MGVPEARSRVNQFDKVAHTSAGPTTGPPDHGYGDLPKFYNNNYNICINTENFGTLMQPGAGSEGQFFVTMFTVIKVQMPISYGLNFTTNDPVTSVAWTDLSRARTHAG